MKSYIGVSRSASLNEDSLDSQEALIRSHARSKGYILRAVHKFSEGAAEGSARPIWESILGYVKENTPKIEGIIFCSHDRASRCSADVVELRDLGEQHGFRVVFVNDDDHDQSPEEILSLSIQSALVLYQEESRAEGTRHGVASLIRSLRGGGQ